MADGLECPRFCGGVERADDFSWVDALYFDVSDYVGECGANEWSLREYANDKKEYPDEDVDFAEEFESW